jgi:hypothetical protein
MCAGRSSLCRQARKGSARFSKRQNSKSKSPRTSLSSVDAEAAASEGTEERAPHSRPAADSQTRSPSLRPSPLSSLDPSSNSELTARLAQTNVQMKKLSATLSCAARPREESGLAEWPLEEEVVVSGRPQAAGHPLVTTTRIRVVDPLEGMIESMLTKPEEASSSSSSDEYHTPVVSRGGGLP